MSAILHSSAHGATLGTLWLCPAPLRTSIEAGSWQALGSDPTVSSNSQHWKEYGCQGYNGQRFPKHRTRGTTGPVTTRTEASAHLCSRWVYLCNTRTWRRQCTSRYQRLWQQPGRAASLLRSPWDRAKMNISNTCQFSSSPDPPPPSLQEVTASGWHHVTWFSFHFLYTYLSVAKGTSFP